MNKFRNKSAKSRDGKLFASIAERDRYEELLLLQKGKHIAALECQPVYPIEVHGVRICKYIADFTYLDYNGPTDQPNTALRIVEDVKGQDTPLFRLKAKLFRACYPNHELRIMRRNGRGFVADTGTRRKATAKRRSGRSSGM